VTQGGAAQTGGDFSLMERRLPVGGRRPPAHRHSNCSEGFFVLEGTIAVELDGESLGLGIESKVLLVIVLVFFGVFFNAFQGVREVDRNLIANATILGGSRWQVTRHVVLPSAFTWIIASLHVSFGFALIGAIVGEFLGGREGLGVLIKEAQGNFNANGVWAAMVIMGVVALVAEWLITRLENRLLRWRPPQLAGPEL
jgi:sulfonate transport system permease protein